MVKTDHKLTNSIVSFIFRYIVSIDVANVWSRLTTS